jgi:serine/threonine protein kinase
LKPQPHHREIVVSLIGQTLGSYRILAELGRGGMGTVYRAVHVTRGYPIALKVLAPQLAQSPNFARRFLREMEAMRRLHHRHIVRLYQAGQAQGMLYMAMELLEGGSLDRRLAEGPLDLPSAVAILAQVAAALDHAHHHGVIHRDVKPSNVLFARDGRAVLGDFGLAKVAGQSRLTQTGVAVGTPEYSSPEQAQGRSQPDHRTDVYSLGVVAYQMLTGHVPFERDNTWATLLAHIRETPPPLQHWNRSIPPAVQAAVLRALEKSPDQRFASAGQFAQALVAAAGGAAVLGNLGVKYTRTPTPQLGSGMQLNAKSIWLVIALAVATIGTVVLVSLPPVPLTTPTNLPPVRGPLIAFESDQDGNKEIYVADPTGRSRWRLTDHPAMDWAPAWAPDGQRLAFVSDRSGFMDIYTMNRQGQGVINLTHSPAQDSNCLRYRSRREPGDLRDEPGRHRVDQPQPKPCLRRGPVLVSRWALDRFRVRSRRQLRDLRPAGGRR